MTNIFLDTVGVLGLWDESDQWHTAAAAAFANLQKAPFRLFSTSYVLLEIGNAAARRPYRTQAKLLRDQLAQAGCLIEPTADDAAIAWDGYDRSKPGGAGIVDHFSFVVMRRLGLRQAFTNDQHFRVAGFETLF